MRNDEGTAAVELVWLSLAMFALFASMVVAGRITLAKQAADAAAYDAARTASLARDAGSAQAQAQAAALASFASQGITCVTLQVTVNTGGFAVPVGQPATVSASVSCDAQLSDVALSPLPGNIVLSSSFVSPLDRYRSRS